MISHLTPDKPQRSQAGCPYASCRALHARGCAEAFIKPARPNCPMAQEDSE